MDRENGVEAVSGKEGKFGDIGVMSLNMDFGEVGGCTNAVDFDLVGFYSDDAGPLAGERERTAPRTTAQIEHSHPFDFAEKTTVQTLGVVWSKLDIIVGAASSRGSSGGVAGPGLHVRDCSLPVPCGA